MRRRLLTLSEYQSLAEIRHQIRRYLHAGEVAARMLGLEPRQHQMLLAIQGMPTGVRPNVGEVAARLQIEHHSAVELVNRLAAAGYVRREHENGDRREVLLVLTPKGSRILGELAEHHAWELEEGAHKLSVAVRRALRPVARSRAAAG
jgi:DNA-binding MarR family transcriptional regulator